MAVRLAATGGIGRLFAGAVAGGFRVRPVGPLAKFMRMARHLRYGEGRVPHSAGHTQTWPPNLCLPPPQEVRMMYDSA